MDSSDANTNNVRDFSMVEIKKTVKGTKTHIGQRVSAIALIPLSIWLVISSIAISQDHAQPSVTSFITSPINICAAILLIIAFLYHGTLGMKVVIEDYIHCTKAKHLLLMLIYFVSVTSAIAGICAVLITHILFFITPMLV